MPCWTLAPTCRTVLPLDNEEIFKRSLCRAADSPAKTKRIRKLHLPAEESHFPAENPVLVSSSASFDAQLTLQSSHNAQVAATLAGNSFVMAGDESNGHVANGTADAPE